MAPYFFGQIENGQTSPVMVTDQHFLNIVRDYVIPLLQEHTNENIIFMQDSAPPHICNPVEPTLLVTALSVDSFL